MQHSVSMVVVSVGTGEGTWTIAQKRFLTSTSNKHLKAASSQLRSTEMAAHIVCPCLSSSQNPKLMQQSAKCAVRAEIINELIPEMEGPAIFWTSLLALIAFRLIPAICPARGAKPENYWKL